MDFVFELLWNSYVSSLFVSLTRETVWFSLLIFKQTAILPATFLALIASCAAYATNYSLGWLLARDRTNMPLPEEKYLRAQAFFNKYLLWLLLVAWTPFLPIISMAAGFLQSGFRRVLLMVICGRAFYYGYYLISTGALQFL